MCTVTKVTFIIAALAVTALGGSVLVRPSRYTHPSVSSATQTHLSQTKRAIDQAVNQAAKLPNFPDLIRAAGYAHGFASVDRDGVYRSYHVDGHVLDAARLSRAQLNTYLDALEGAVTAGEYDEVQLAADRVHFSTVNSAAVPEDQLLHPSIDVVPTAKLAHGLQQLHEYESRNGGLARRQYEMCVVHNYCMGTGGCGYPCYCNGVICV
jgi:hypothetical protein